MTQIAANFNLRRKLYNARFGVLERYMRERGLRRPLQRRIRRFYEYYLERKSVFSIESILHEVSSTLKHELCDHFFGDITPSDAAGLAVELGAAPPDLARTLSDPAMPSPAKKKPL